MDSQSSKEIKEHALTNAGNNSQKDFHESETDSPNANLDGFMSNPPCYKEEDHEENQDEDEDENENPKIYNKRALSKVGETYELETFEENLLIIFNQVSFDGCDRVGSDKDIEALKKTFEKFGFTIEEISDKPIISELDNLATRDLTDYGCIAVVVLTCLSTDGRLRAHDDFFTERDIIQRLKANRNKTVLTKPKIILIQTFRHPATSTTLDSNEMPDQVYYDSKVENEQLYTLPVESDILIIHSSYEGNSTYKPINGSWFIQNLCSRIDNMADKEDLGSILISMKRSVAIDMEGDMLTEKDAMEIPKNMPVITSTLIRKLYLKKYGGALSNTIPSSCLDNFETPRIRGPTLTPFQLEELKKNKADSGNPVF